MTYASTADIQAELKNLNVSATSAVTSAAISDFLDQSESLINMHVGKRYVTPITATESVLVLRKIEIDFVVYRVSKILDLKKSVPIPDARVIQDITEGSAYRDSMKTLMAIRDNKMDLPGETLINNSSALSSFHTETGNSGIVPLFEKGVQQW